MNRLLCFLMREVAETTDSTFGEQRFKVETKISRGHRVKNMFSLPFKEGSTAYGSAYFSHAMSIFRFRSFCKYVCP